MENKMNRLTRILVGIFGALIILAVLYAAMCFRTVPFGYVRAVTLFGDLTGEVWGPGAHWKLPWEGTRKIATFQRSYETSDNPDESEANYTDYTIPGQTFDGQQISINYTVVFSIPIENVVSVLDSYGSLDMAVENVVKVYSRSYSRQYAQESYTAPQLYGDGIMDYEAEVQAALEIDFAARGILLDDLLIRKISFSEEYIQSVEAKQIAEQNITTQEFNADAAVWQAQQVIEQARGEAEKQILMAQAQAQQITLVADADAYAIEVKGEALRNNPEMLQWEFVSNLTDVSWGILDGSGLNLYMPTQR